MQLRLRHALHARRDEQMEQMDRREGLPSPRHLAAHGIARAGTTANNANRNMIIDKQGSPRPSVS